MRAGLLKTMSLVLVPAVLLLALPAVCSAEALFADGSGLRADESSEGAMITIGVLGTCLAVLFLVNLKMDIDNIFGRRQAPAREINVDESVIQRLQLTLEVPAMGTGGGEGELRVADAVGLGVRLDF